MDKRKFLKTASTFTGAALLAPLIQCNPNKKEMESTSALYNWAGNLQFSTSQIHEPKNLEQAVKLVKELPKLRVLGSRHSFNTIADSDRHLISTNNLNQLVNLDKVNGKVTVEAGMKYGDLCLLLEKEGYALHNLASLPHISIAGSISTGTHGSGIGNGNLSSAVAAIEFIDGKGELVKLERERDGNFMGAVVALGALGMMTKVTLDIEPSYQMAQVIYKDLPMSALKQHFVEIMSTGYSVSLFTDWTSENINQVWIKKRAHQNGTVDFPSDLFGALPFETAVHPVPGISPESCTTQMGQLRKWYEILPHFKMEFQPSAGKELQSEYFIPVEHAFEAISSIQEMAKEISPFLFISEIRAIKSDALWLSPCYQRDTIAIHTTWKQEIPEVMGILPKMEEKLAPFQARPHWAKLFTIPPSELEKRYPKLNDFRRLMQNHDPDGKFRNSFIEQNILGNA
ncbi:D-arabinono-1,4-lactone oxidase [Cecembia calidifontis]|uniref:Xylitol oxidase n=1 Tax=Cecembia calidifontis TaxID=1187080 RepID=A0A4Q7P4P9_9BACT|nr:D-arabinono-1,4-lactone oxidase [Cecembia calidifontis]RZS94983.1 xylitol oxidase [Cecembia calidifontis]